MENFLVFYALEGSGMNRSYASKPGHLFFTAYVSMSLWFSS